MIGQRECKSSEGVDILELEAVDELDHPSSASLEQVITTNGQRVLLDAVQLNDFAYCELLADPAVDCLLHRRRRPPPASSAFPVDALSGPTLDVFAGNVEFAADFGDGHLFLEQQAHCLLLLRHGVALVWPSLVVVSARRMRVTTLLRGRLLKVLLLNGFLLQALLQLHHRSLAPEERVSHFKSWRGGALAREGVSGGLGDSGGWMRAYLLVERSKLEGKCADEILNASRMSPDVEKALQFARSCEWHGEVGLETAHELLV